MAPRGTPLALLAALLCGGCTVVVYQPMSGLHRPVAVDPSRPNFTDVDIEVRCPPGGAVDATEAGALCRRVARLFENQGARVEIHTPGAPAADPEPDGEAPATPRTALRVELTARILHREITDWLFWEHVSDYTVAQDVVIRDETGFMLARDTLTGRFVKRWGFFSDADEDFSIDFYAQLSQLALNARVRRRVLAEGRLPGPG